MEHEHFKRVVEYVAMQCTGCSDSPIILALKAYEIMKKAEYQRNLMPEG